MTKAPGAILSCLRSEELSHTMEWEKYIPEEREAMRALGFMRYEDAPRVTR